ncbi:MAG: hypothetical protein L0K47_12995, partial [Acidipropionibacterium jensenii]|nr:hypothetical protein [Acidipropionibacterium jensenii]MDN6514201.1 hypothetical protein [Acidipropionibacterium jensenii]MDN6593167.1 hypothetical protein [Acidipropionibacterium jensenii]MDN6793405.1 hypothetical protein [Acidipropionibacterium jensenii]
MCNATFVCPDLTTFCRIDELGLEVVGQRLDSGSAVLACRVVEPDDWCRRCGCRGKAVGTVVRRLAHEPLGWRPTILEVRVRRYRCTGCGHVWRQDITKAAWPRAKLSRCGLRWALEAIVVQHLTVARVAEGLDVSWNTANDAVLAEGKRVLIDWTACRFLDAPKQALQDPGMLLYLSSGVLVMGEVVTVGGDGLSVRGVSAFDGGERGDGAFEGVGGLGEGEVGGFAQG